MASYKGVGKGSYLWRIGVKFIFIFKCVIVQIKDFCQFVPNGFLNLINYYSI